MDVDAVTLVIIVFVVALTTFVFSVLGKYCGEKFLGNPKRRQRPRSSRIPKCYQCSYGGREYPSKRFRRRSNDGGVSFAVHRPSASPEEIRLNTMRPAAGAVAAPGLATTAGNESSQTFARLGIRASKEGRNIIDLEGQLHHDDTSPLTKNRSSEYHLNEIRKSSARKRLSKNITFGPDQNGGSYSNYEELAEVGQPRWWSTTWRRRSRSSWPNRIDSLWSWQAGIHWTSASNKRRRSRSKHGDDCLPNR